MPNPTEHDAPARDIGSEFDERRYGVARGRTPRSDAEIREELMERLQAFDGAPVEVVVAEGVVTLTGRVGIDETRRSIEELVGAVVGVTAVHNRLDVVPDETH